MRYIKSLVIICLALDSCFAARAELVVPDDYPTIRQAIDAAHPGDTVLVRPGVYNESLIFKEGIRLKGEGRDEVVLRWNAQTSPVITVTNCGRGTISELTLSQTGVEQLKESLALCFPILFVNASSIEITNCRVCSGGNNGISLVGQGRSKVSNCTIEQNALNGILITNKGAAAVLDNNTCCNNGGSGIYFFDGAAGIAENNICSNNSHNGIVVRGKDTKPELRNNRCSQNQGSGILIGDSAAGKVEENICEKNEMHGICVADGLSSSWISNNHCLDNKRMGLYCFQWCNAKTLGNIFKNNGEINCRQIRHLFFDKNFDALEEMVARLQKEKSRFLNGEWQLAYFYSSAARRWNEYETIRNKAMKNLDSWTGEKPQSVTPLIIKAQAHIYIAWRDRGGNFAPEVTATGWKGFYDNLQKAWKALKKAEELNVKDPHLYSTFLTVGMGLSIPDEQMNSLFERGVSIEPIYYPLYYGRATSLLPRWGGEHGALEKFASRVASNSKQEQSEALYARIAAYALDYTGWKTFPNYKFSYPRIQQGHKQILKQYPQADYYLNSYCLCACIYKDKETARELFDKIGNNWNKRIWSNVESFSSYKIWANKE